MKKLLYGLLFLAQTSWAVGVTSSFVPVTSNEFQLNTWMGAVGFNNRLGSMLREAHDVAIGQWKYSESGGATGDHYIGITLPAGTIIWNVVFDTVAGPSCGIGTIAFTAQTAGDLKAAVSNWSGRVQGIPASSVSNAIKLSDARKLYATIAGVDCTAGHIKVFVEYFRSE